MKSLKRVWWSMHSQARHWSDHRRLLALETHNRFSRAPVLGQAPVAVSLTSYGDRLDAVHLTIESICSSKCRPSRLTLWLDDARAFANLPAALRRLQRRGLEVTLSANFGPHTKYFPYLRAFPGDDLPLVTADDDLIYPQGWLERLVKAHQREPQLIHCYRARTIVIDGQGLRPYAEWPLTKSDQPQGVNFLTGVSGVIYPQHFLGLLRNEGTAFQSKCPKADDVWLNVIALRGGVRIRQLDSHAAEFPEIPGSQASALWPSNQLGGANDAQIRSTYTEADLALLRMSR